MNFLRRLASVASLAKTKRVARATAGYLLLALSLSGCSIDWLGDIASQIGDFLTVLAENYFHDIPTTPLEIIEYFYGDKLVNLLDAMYAKFLQMPRLEGTLVFWILIFFGALASALLIGKLIVYMLKVAAYTFEYSNIQILKGETSLTSPVVYIPFRYAPAQLLIFAAPILVGVVLTSMHGFVSDAILALYEAETIGGVTYDLILTILEGKGIIWFALSLPIFVGLIMVFLLVYAMLNIAVVFLTGWSLFQVARHGDGESSGYVITDAVLTTFKAAALVIIVQFEIGLGPRIISTAPLSWFPAAIALIAWLAFTIATPFLIWFLGPKIERFVISSASKAAQRIRRFAYPEAPYRPRHKWLDRTEDRYAKEPEGPKFKRLREAPGRVFEVYQAYRSLQEGGYI